MAKQLNVNLAFNADTSGAIKNLNELNNVLSKIGSMNISSGNMSAEMKQAALSAQELQTHLNKAYDSKLGNLNLSKFEQSLKSSNTSLSKLSTDLLGAGRNGEQAFLRLQSSIASANTQLTQSQGLLSNFLTSLKNTARWQISSSILHGFMGTIQSAYSYSQKLNESLNNIRIVTGQNVDQMAEFAEQANKAAKALGTSTTEYTNASLIYYQQGLKGNDVTERSDVTVKMANVANKSAQEVSDQMTAVWNNFYDGSKSLEYYADVMTALGAATASSTDEIAGGLEKFAAVADTIGLSYEYAAAALATITSNTRQSEEVVGTALKTIFARIQGLNLGETLDDGTTLNKYSEALQKVGISIFDATGNLRNMDDILDDMGNKWDNLNKAQQTALAQTVAGTRQYTQLVALMDNWNKGDADSFQSTLATAYGAEGALSEQHDIYLQGWEAAQKKVKAGFEAIYKELVPDESFTKLYNGFADVLGIVETLVKTLGGLEGIILLASSLLLTKFAPNIGQAIDTGIAKFVELKNNIFSFNFAKNAFAPFAGIKDGAMGIMTQSADSFNKKLTEGSTLIEQQQSKMLQMASSVQNASEGFKVQVNALRETSVLTQKVKLNTGNITKDTAEDLMNQIEKTRQLSEQEALLTQQHSDLQFDKESQIIDTQTEAYNNLSNFNFTPSQIPGSEDTDSILSKSGSIEMENLNKQTREWINSLIEARDLNIRQGDVLNNNTMYIAKYTDAEKEFVTLIGSSVDQLTATSNIVQQISDIQLNESFKDSAAKAEEMTRALEGAEGISQAVKDSLKQAIMNYKSSGSKQGLSTDLAKTLGLAKSLGQQFGVNEKILERAIALGRKDAELARLKAQKNNEYNMSLENTKKNIEQAVAASLSMGNNIAKGLSSLSSMAMSFTTISNGLNTISDSSASFSQKLAAGAMMVTASWRMVTTTLGGISNILNALNSTTALNTTIMTANAVVTKTLTAEKAKEQIGLVAELMMKKEVTDAEAQSLLVEELGINKKRASALVKLLSAGASKTEAKAIEGKTGAEIADIVVTNAGTAANTAFAVSTYAMVPPLLIVAAIILALVAVFAAFSAARKKEIETNKQSAESAQEAAKAAREEAEANRDLATSYYDALKSYQETGEGKKECIDAALAAAKAYEIEGAEVLILAGKYDELNKKIRQRQQEEAKDRKTKTNIALDTTTVAMSDALREGTGYKTGSGGYKGTFGTGWDNSDELAARTAIEQGNYQYLSKDSAGNVSFNVSDISSPEQMYAYYQELETFLESQREIANKEGLNLGSSEIYQEALEEYNSGLEYYEQLKELMGEIDTINSEIFAFESTSKYGKGINEISSLKEYEEFQESYLQKQSNLLKSKGIEEGTDEWDTKMEAAKAYLGTLAEIQDYYLESQSFETLSDQGLNEDKINEVKEWYATLNDVDKELFWQIEIDENSSLDSMQSAMEQLQQYADTNNLVANIKIAADVEGLLTQDSKNWDDIQTKMIAMWKKEGASDEQIEKFWLDFLGMDDAGRIKYVQDLQAKGLQQSSKTVVQNVEKAKLDYENTFPEIARIKQEITDKEAEYDRVGQSLEEQKALFESQLGEFYTLMTSTELTTDDALRFNANQDNNIWDNLYQRIENGEVDLSTDSRMFDLIHAMSENDGNFGAYVQGVTKDDQFTMQLLSQIPGWTKVNENGTLSWDMNGQAANLFNSDGSIRGSSSHILETALQGLQWDNFQGAFGYMVEESALSNVRQQQSDILDEIGTTDNPDPDSLRGQLSAAEGKQGTAYEAYETALKSQADWDDAFEANNEKLNLDSDVINDYADDLLEMAENGEQVSESLKGQANASKLVAQGIVRMNKGVSNLSEKWKDYGKNLTADKKLTEAYSTSMASLRTDVEDILDLDMSSFSDDWFTTNENMALFDRIAKGDVKAIDELREAAAKEILLKSSMDNTEAEAALAALKADMDNIEDLKIGTSVEINDALGSLSELYTQGKITAEELENALQAIGWEPQIEYETVTVAEAKQFHQTGQLIGADGSVQTIQLANYADDGALVRVPILKGKGISGTATYKGSGGSTVSPPKTQNNGGGGGGSKSHADKKSDSDKTRYHTLENQLEDLKSQYEEISKAKDNAFGTKKLALMDEEIAKTDELIAKQEEYLDAIEENLPKDRAIMDAYYDKVIGGPAIAYDENGNIANYDAIQDAMYAKYNEMADKYTSDSEEWKVFEKQYEQMEKYIEQYEETYDLLRDEEAEYQELLRQRMDQELEKIQYQIELKLNIAEDSLALLEHQLERIDDDASKAAEAIGLFSEKAESLYDQMQADREGLNDILGQHLSEAEIKMFYDGDMSVLQNKDFTENQIAAIKEYRDNLLDLNSEMMAIRDSVQEQLMEVFDDWNEKLEAGTQTLEHYGSVLESYKNIIDVVGKDTLGLSDEFMSDLGQAQVSNAIDQVNASRDVYESMVNAQREAEQALAQARANGDTESIKYWEDTLASITENAQSAQEELLDSWEAALSAIADQFETTVQTLIDNFNDSVYSLGGLEGLSEDFSRQKENADMMLDDYQKIYELSKLSRDINGKLDDTKIIAGKQKLRDLLEKINDLQEDGVEMSQYDLEYLQKEYDLRLAEIELEEAQRAKNTVRMSRDNEGNWSYVYTQNTDAVDSAQQKYEDALYAMQDLSSNYIDEMSEQLIATSQEMQEALAAIRIEDYASIEEYYAEVERVQKQYQDELAMQEAELNKAISNNKTLYEEDWTNYHNATGYKISDTQDFATAFKDTMLGTLMGSEEDTSNFTSIIGSAVSSLTTGLMEAAQVYYTNLDSAMEAAGTSTENFAEDTAANIDAVVEKSKEGAAAVDQMAEEMDEAFSAITETITAWQETYGLAMQEIIDSNIAVVESFNAMLEALSIDAGKITVNYDINTTPDGVDPAAFDTGGYTGKWGDAGKLAVLHEKELILNQDDTEKFMKAMAYSKMILDTIDLNAKYASMGMGEIVPTLIKEEAPQTLEQMVHITAEFPGVNDHYEIEEAFNNLINKASQYANRKL